MGTMQDKQTFQSESTERFAFSNPEYADMDNPTGRVYQEAWVVSAFTDYGEAYHYTGEVVDEEHAARLVEIFQHQNARGELDITKSEEWSFNRYMYGSKAFVDNYHEATIAMMDDEEIDYHMRNGSLW